MGNFLILSARDDLISFGPWALKVILRALARPPIISPSSTQPGSTRVQSSRNSSQRIFSSFAPIILVLSCHWYSSFTFRSLFTSSATSPSINSNELDSPRVRSGSLLSPQAIVNVPHTFLTRKALSETITIANSKLWYRPVAHRAPAIHSPPLQLLANPIPHPHPQQPRADWIEAPILHRSRPLETLLPLNPITPVPATRPHSHRHDAHEAAKKRPRLSLCCR